METRYNYNFKRLKKYSIEEFKKIVGDEHAYNNQTEHIVDFDGIKIKVNRSKIQSYFQSNFTCEHCKTQASYIAIEQNADEENGKIMINAYVTKDGQDMLLVRDFHIPERTGGLDIPDNWFVLCDECYLDYWRPQKQQIITSFKNMNCLGYIVLVNGTNVFLNIKMSRSGQLNITYEGDHRKALIYKDKSEVKKLIRKAIKMKSLPFLDMSGIQLLPLVEKTA